MSLATTTVKHLLLLLNFIFAVLCLVLIGFGIFFLISVGENTVSVGENVAGGLIITLGVVILLSSVFGCLAVIYEAHCRLLIYVVSLLILILLQLLMLSMTSYDTKDGLSGSIQEGFELLWNEEVKEPGALAYYEKWLHCCGVNGTEDYLLIRHQIPSTCCKIQNCTNKITSVSANTRIIPNTYVEGCQRKFEKYLTDKLLIFKIVCWLLIIGETVTVFFGWVLFNNIKNQSRRNVSWM